LKFLDLEVHMAVEQDKAFERLQLTLGHLTGTAAANGLVDLHLPLLLKSWDLVGNALLVR
jgi:hypothetical protein